MHCSPLLARLSALSIDYPAAVILGTAQDAGYPSAGCQRDCCRRARLDPALARHPASLAIIDAEGGRWLVDCTPHFPQQLAMLDELLPVDAEAPGLRGIFLTHAHIGHYTGLMQLGREVLGTAGLPVYCMPGLRRFLLDNGPWNQLVRIGNIELRELKAGRAVGLPGMLSVEPLPVPHRAEYSETVAFILSGVSHRLLYLPDIDSWEGLDPSIDRLLSEVDIALLDGTFFSGEELPGRNMGEIPHPTVEHSMRRFSGLPELIREKIHFFHLNHTNPLLNAQSPELARLYKLGYRLARQGAVLPLQ